MKRAAATTTCSILLALSCLAANAGGPLLVGGNDGRTPVRYQDPTVTVHVESGALGALNNTAAVALVDEAFTLWSDAASSSLTLLSDTSTITVDVDIDNFEDYLPSVDNSVQNDDDGVSPMVFDQNGEIIDAYFGTGQSEFLVGVAISVLSDSPGFYREGYALINGRTDLNISVAELRILITHEIGHLFGLDHTQTDIDNTESDTGTSRFCRSTVEQNYAVMYPFICRDSASLHADDISAVSALYPGASINQQLGIIQGHLLEVDGTPVLGANIWAENVSTGDAISIISDYLLENNGYYRLYLPPGNYTLHANSVNTAFVDASRVGPYSLSLFDASFQDPHPIGQIDYLGTTEEETVLTLDAGQTLDITFDLEGKYIEGTADTSDEDESLADLFGSISLITGLMLAGTLTGLRAYSHKAGLSP